MSQTSRLRNHFALCTAAAASVVAAQANADVVYSGVVNIVVPANIDGTYLNVETGVFSSSAAAVPGWDVNPYGTSLTAVSLYAASGTGFMRNPGAGTSTARTLLDADTSIDAASFFYGSSSATIGTLVGQWSANAEGVFGFKFNGADGLLHYGWLRLAIGANAATRTIVDYAYDNIPATGVRAGSGGGPPPAYDPCGAFNPVAAIGNNNLPLNLTTATDLDLGSCGVAYKANYFKFVAPADGAYSFSACATAEASVAVLDGCAAGSAVLNCSAGTGACQAGLALTSGQTVYLVVGGAAASTVLTSPIGIAVGGPPLPACTSAVAAVFGDNIFDDSASTTPQVVQSDAAATATATIQRSTWFTFTPGATGAYSFRTCGSTGDTMMAIGVACPSIGATFATIAYNDDAPNCLSGASSLASIIDATNGGATGTFAGFPLTQDLVAGTQYYIVAGSYGATTIITGILNIDGPPQSQPCPGDYDLSGIRDGADLATLLSAWATPGGDIDGDGDTSGSDLATLLSGWGACP